MYSDIALPVYIINLKERPERLAHALNVFNGLPEFQIHPIEACKHKIGAVGLWQSIVNVVKMAYESNEDVIVLCEDDLVLTPHYNRNLLIEQIVEAAAQGVEMLMGGVAGFGSAVPVARNRYWVDWFWGTHFVVLYRTAFQKILDYEFKDTDTADGVFSEITSHKMLLYPFISIQKDFGYSDVTQSNDKLKGKVDALFLQAESKMAIYHQANLKYLQNQ